MFLLQPRPYVDGGLDNLSLIGAGGLFYCTTEASSLIKDVHPLSNVLTSLEVTGSKSAKSTLAEYVKRLCLCCVDELLAASLKFLEVDNLTKANDGYKKFGFAKCVGEKGVGSIDGHNTS